MSQSFDFSKLKQEALNSPKLRSRQIIVPGFDMIICLAKRSYVRMHRHPKYEGYQILEGRMVLYTEKEEYHYGAISPIVAIPAGTWHMPKAESKFCIYREFYAGPWEKERDVEYHPDHPEEKA